MDNRARAAMIRRVERKIKKKYRKTCVWCFLIALIIGLVLGFFVARQVLPSGESGEPVASSAVTTPTPDPDATQAPIGALALRPQEATATPTPEPTPTPTPMPTPTPTVNIADAFGLSSEDLGITPEPAAVAETPIPVTTQPAVQPVATPVATQENVLLTITPTPAAQGDALNGQTSTLADALGGEQATEQTAAQAQTTVQPTEQTVAQDPNAKGSKSNPYLLNEVFSFDTEVLPSGWPRVNTSDTTYDTVRLSISLNNYLTPDYFAENYSNVIRLTGTEAGAELTVTVESSTGTSAIMPQNAIDIVFENEAGLENEGYSIMDADILGKYEISIQPGQTMKVYKRFLYTDAEDMRYMVVKYYRGGQEYKTYFKLEVYVPEVVYTELSSGSRGDDVRALQERLIELGYLDDTADGIFGNNTANAISAAQEQAGMTVTGIADDAFQQYIYSDSAASSAS